LRGPIVQVEEVDVLLQSRRFRVNSLDQNTLLLKAVQSELDGTRGQDSAESFGDLLTAVAAVDMRSKQCEKTTLEDRAVPIRREQDGVLIHGFHLEMTTKSRYAKHCDRSWIASHEKGG
jgi:hypothetical protein